MLKLTMLVEQRPANLRVARFAFWFLAFVGPVLAAEKFCALTVELLDRDGAPAKLTPVQLIGPSGEIVFNDQVSGSKLRICDFGFGLHKLVVGPSYCHPITISGLRLRLGKPMDLTVRMNGCPPDIWGGSLCSVYLRVREPTGARVEGSSLSFGPSEPAVVTDEFGRVGNSLVAGSSISATLSKVGYVSQHFSLSCKQSEDIEREVVLERDRPSKHE